MARIIEFFDGATSELTPTIGNIEASDLVDFADDASYEAANVGTPFAGNIYFNTTSNTVRYYDGTQWLNVGRQVDIQANASDIADIRTTTGTADGDTNMGTYTGSLLNDNESTKQNIQQLETAVEANTTASSANTSDIADIRTTQGTSDGDTNLGTFTGTTISDNNSVKGALQELETAVEAIPSGLVFQGTWNADTNSPALVSSTGTAGHYYIVSVAGSTNLDGITDWGVGDWAVFSDSGVWQKIDNSETVTSVNGQTGTVALDAADIPYDNTASGLTATDVQAAIDEHVITPTSSTLVDLQGTTQTSAYIVNDTAGYYAAQSFRATNSVDCVGGSVDMSRDVNVTGGTFRIDLYTTTGPAAFGGSQVATTGALPYTTITSTNGLAPSKVDFTFTTPYTMTANDYYYIRIENIDFVNGTTANAFTVAYTSTNPYADGQVLIQNASPNAQPTHDLLVTVNTGATGFATKHSADEISYNNATSGLVATETQSAIDELKVAVDAAGGSGQGGINYIINTDFEDDVSETSSTGNVLVNQNTSSRVRGVGSLQADFLASATTADYFEINMNALDTADIGKQVYISFDYSTDLAFSDNEAQVVLYDNTGAVEIPVIGGNGSGNIAEADAGAQIVKSFTGIAYLPETNTDFSLRIKSTVNRVAGATIYVDNVIVGPDKLIDSPVISEWQAFTPTGSWDNTTYTGYYRRVGDSAEIDVQLDCSAAPTVAGLSINMVPGLTIDTGKLTSRACGSAQFVESGVREYVGAVSVIPGSNFFIIKHTEASNAGNVNNVSPFTWGAADKLSFTATVPVEEWANSSAIISDKELLNITAKSKATRSATGTLPTSPTVLVFNTEVYDTNGSYNAGTGVYTVKKAGYYKINAYQIIDAAGVNRFDFFLQKNGSTLARNFEASNSGQTITNQIFTTDYFNLGDTIQVVSNMVSADGSTYSGAGGQFMVEELPDFSVYGVYPEPLKTQQKFLTSDITSDGVMSDLTFSNLKVGQWYQINGQFDMELASSTNHVVAVVPKHNGLTVGLVRQQTTANDSRASSTWTYIFQAEATTFTFEATDASATDFIRGTGTADKTWVQITEIQPRQVTNEY